MGKRNTASAECAHCGKPLLQNKTQYDMAGWVFCIKSVKKEKRTCWLACAYHVHLCKCASKCTIILCMKLDTALCSPLLHYVYHCHDVACLTVLPTSNSAMNCVCNIREFAKHKGVLCWFQCKCEMCDVPTGPCRFCSAKASASTNVEECAVHIVQTAPPSGARQSSAAWMCQYEFWVDKKTVKHNKATNV